jgi:hypothetical protein
MAFARIDIFELEASGRGRNKGRWLGGDERTVITKAQKAAYDREYRKKNRERLRIQKARYFKATYDPVEAAKKRKERMPQHVDYCRQPKYRAWKKEYDRKRRLLWLGEFLEAYEALRALMAEVKRQMPDRFERYAQAGRMQWNPINQQRRRRKSHERNTINSDYLERISLGNP